MERMLNERRAQLLSLIIREYVDSAQPVGSETIVRKHELPYSSATIRNEMARLEEEGYISHPHTSAGRVPSDQGYRYYVDSLSGVGDLARAQQDAVMRYLEGAAGLEE